MIVYLRDEDPKQREGAVNTISRIEGYEKSKGIVEELISQLERERNLRVIARISRALTVITKEEFKPLDKTGILNWWTIHKSDQQYKSPYLGFKKAWPFLMKTDDTKDIPSMISALDETLAVDPDAVYTRVLKGRCLTLSDKLDDAEKEFAEAEKRQTNFRWLLLWRSSVLFKRGKSDDAVASINACFVRSPGLATFAKTLPDYTELLRNPKIVWPKKD